MTDKILDKLNLNYNSRTFPEESVEYYNYLYLNSNKIEDNLKDNYKSIKFYHFIKKY